MDQHLWLVHVGRRVAEAIRTQHVSADEIVIAVTGRNVNRAIRSGTPDGPQAHESRPVTRRIT